VARTGGLVEPLAGGGLPESPETKRRLRNIIEVTGLARELEIRSAEPASREALLRVHPADYLDRFEQLSATGGGEMGERTPFGPGGFGIATLSAGLIETALKAVLEGRHTNAYALCRPPGHHCLPATPMGFCLLANIAIAIRSARAAGLATRFAVVDWDVHHGNGTEAIFAEDPHVLTISVHQRGNYPLGSGEVAPDATANINIPLPPGAGHRTYIEAFDRIVTPALHAFGPDVIVVASGFDASGVDPLSRTLCRSHTFAEMTGKLMDAAAELCGGRIAMAHEGGYSEVHVPFCGHAVLQRMSGSAIHAEDPLDPRILAHQPDPDFESYLSARVGAIAEAYRL
ncbi:MAG: class II histone deacetylase, partial [Rubricella sp.]